MSDGINPFNATFRSRAKAAQVIRDRSVGALVHLLGCLPDGMSIPGVKHDPNNEIFFCGATTAFLHILFEENGDICSNWKIDRGHRVSISRWHSTWFLKTSYEDLALHFCP
jgi:hypothetical protein